MDSNRDMKGQLVDLVTDKYAKLNHLWGLYGFPTTTIDKRNHTMLKHTEELFIDMLSEEEKRVQEKRDEVVGYQKSIEKICKDLGEDIPKLSSTTLIQQCEELFTLEKELREKKEEKMKEWIEMKKQEKSLRDDLGEEITEDIYAFDGIPGKEHIQALKVVLNELSMEKSNRIKEFGRLKSRIQQLLEFLEEMPSSEIEIAMTEVGNMPVLSVAFLEKCKETESVLDGKIKSNCEESEKLREEIEELLRRLKDEPEAVGVTLPKGYKPTALVEIRAEHTRLTLLKMANLDHFIQRVRMDIEQISNDVYKKPLLPEGVDPTEDSLAMHEKILDSLKTYQNEHKKVLELWKKRESVWTQWLEYEAKADDPNRFNNRGGTLLKEEKIRKGLEKSLPKLETEIITLAGTSPAFKVLGEDVKNIITTQWNTFNHEKEEKKLLKKQQTGTNNTMNVTRKRPMTPAATGGGTPAGKRGKMMSVTPAKNPTTPKRVLRSSSSAKDNLPSPTYSEFTSYKQIFQSTMSEPKNLKPAKTTPRGRALALQTPKMVPHDIQDKF